MIHRKPRHISELNIVINGTQIDRVQLFNFLGITLDDDLSWNGHVNLVKKKISKVIGILYRLKHTFPIDVLETLYSSLIASYINYGLLLWGSKSQKNRNFAKESHPLNN